MSDAVIYAWREEQGDVWTGEWALDRADKWVPAKAKKFILATPEALAASPEGQRLIREAEANNRALMMDALAALVSARDTIRRKWGTTNPERERVISALSDALGVEVVPAAIPTEDATIRGEGK